LDLRKDAAEFCRLLTGAIDSFGAACQRIPNPPLISAIEVGFSLGQEGWAAIHFDTRPVHLRDGSWSTEIDKGLVKIPGWKKARGALQKRGGTVIMPDRRKVAIKANVAEARVAAIYGTMIQGVVQQANQDGLFRKLPLRKGCQLDVEEFDGSWAWPAIRALGKTNLVKGAER
jgi:hypothetical protein